MLNYELSERIKIVFLNVRGLLEDKNPIFLRKEYQKAIIHSGKTASDGERKG
jgi:hypothetical protein